MNRVGCALAALIALTTSPALAQQRGDDGLATAVPPGTGTKAGDAQQAQKAPPEEHDYFDAPYGTGRRSGGAQQRPQAPAALLGDWWGFKTTLENAGVKPVVGYKGEFAANVSGGERHDATLVGQLDLGVTLDADKIVGLHGGTFQVSITYRHGPQLERLAGIDDLQQVQEVYGRGQTVRLTEFWYQQSAADGHLILKVGRMPAGDFNTFDCDFENLTFCGAPAGNLTGYYWFNWPIAQWEGWVKMRSDHAYLKVGVQEDNRNNNDNAFFISRSGARGVIYHLEAGWTPKFGGGKLPGRYQAGAWYNTSSDPDVLLGPGRIPFALTGLAPVQRGGQYGVYVQGEQQITGSAKIDPVSGVITRKRGLNAFFNFTRNDPATSTTLHQETVGFYVNAPFKTRPLDQLGLGVGRTAYNARAARALLLADPLSERRRSEYAAELYYGYTALPGLILRPNVQYVVDPGGLRRATDVVILGFRFDANL